MNVFNNLLRTGLKWPMELFDTTPIGRILSRYSKDIDTVDGVLPSIVVQLLNTCFGVKIDS